MNRRRQGGTTLVEFAIVGTLVMILLFGVIEFGRALYVWNTLAESTRRGARVAVVCPPNHAAVRRIAAFQTPEGASTGAGLPGLEPDNIKLEYLDKNGAPTATIADITLVRVSIQNFQYRLLIPFVDSSITVPAFTTTLPAESLGFVPDDGSRQCFGS